MSSASRPHRRRAAMLALPTAMATLLAGITLAPGAVAAEDDVDYAFDFGGPSSPVAEGWTGIHPGSLYSAATGYGFTSPPASDGFRDRGGDDPMTGDFTIGNGQEFVVDVPEGTYEVTTYTGDLIASNGTSFDIEGVAYSPSRTTAGVFDEGYFPAVEVTDGQLTIRVTGGDGRINGIRVQTPLGSPTGLAVTAIDTTDLSLTVGWDAVADATGYTVLRGAPGGDLSPIATVTETSFTDTDVALGESYDYAVATVKGERRSRPGDPVTAAVVDPDVDAPTAPTGLSTTAIDRSSISIAWDDDADVLQWKVLRSTRADIPFEQVAIVTEPTFADDDVLTTRPYLYRVIAQNAGGASEPSATHETEVATTLVRDVEYLDRSPIAVTTDDGVYLGWRLLGLDAQGLAFDVYRDGIKITDAPITGTTDYVDAEGTADAVYHLTAHVDGEEVIVSDEFGVWAQQYLDVPLSRPADQTLPDGQVVTYAPGDGTVGDVDGDGEYELVFLWNPSISKDNSQAGYTGTVYAEAVKLDGTSLWRIDLGVNIRAGAHYTQLIVFDFDGDGSAEVAFKTADGTIDGVGEVIGDAGADYRNGSGYVLDGPEFLTVFDGRTGAAIDTVDYIPARGNVSAWGDGYGNRVDRFLAGIAYLDGEHPSLITSRGYYTRTVIVAWDLVDGRLVERWTFDSDEAGSQYEGQGNHQFTTADVDRDGLDEIVFGAMTIDDDGTVLYNTNLFHGDALHVGDFDLDRDGLEVYGVHESVSGNGGIGASMRDAETGEILWTTAATRDTGRGTAADIDPSSPGAEAWSIGGDYAWNSKTGTLNAADGTVLSSSIPAANFVTWWDGDLTREISDHVYDEAASSGVPTISKWDPDAGAEVELLRLDGTLTNNTTKGTPVIQADLFGDWREEVAVRTETGDGIRIYTTVDPAEARIATLMHDSQYRAAVANQNSAYNQPPTPSFFIGAGMAEPPTASIAYVGGPADDGATAAPGAGTLSNTSGWAHGLHDGTYDVVMNLWWGTPGSSVRLYENGELVGTRILSDTGTSQTARFGFSGKPDGTYVYTAELVNSRGVTATSSTTVRVTAAAPGTPVVSHDNWDRDGSFTATANLWWGTNATSYRFELDGQVIGSGSLTAASPNAQKATVEVSGISPGQHTLVAVFANANGETASQPVTVTVQ